MRVNEKREEKKRKKNRGGKREGGKIRKRAHTHVQSVIMALPLSLSLPSAPF